MLALYKRLLSIAPLSIALLAAADQPQPWKDKQVPEWTDEDAKQAGAKVIEINTETTAFSKFVDCALQGPAGELLPRLAL